MLDDQSLISELARVRRPIGEAHGLPNALYTEAQAHEYERRRVFLEGWASIGFGKDVPNPGDALPIDHVGVPLLLVRDHEGGLKLYQNICRHRGMILVQEKRNFGGVIRCPYHSWCYSLDGKLRATPHVGGPGLNTSPSIDRDKTGLVEVPMGVFMDVVFANVSGTAEPFEDYIRPVRERFAEFADQQIHFGGPESSFGLEINANWKLIVENNCESYHLPWVHPGLNSYSRLEDHYHLEVPGSFSGQGTLVYNPQLDPELRFPDFPGLSDKWDTAAEYASLYPNTFLSVHRDHFWAARLEPVGQRRTLEHVNIYYTTAESAESDTYRPLREKNASQWCGVLTEDVFVTEGMQKGRGALGFDGGVFAPAMDSPTHLFHDWVAAKLGA